MPVITSTAPAGEQRRDPSRRNVVGGVAPL
jgi:hypothetical protein